MTDQFSGLRFDIYERVNLPDDVAAIEELEEIELMPHMQALQQDDHVLLRGHLLLSGAYRSQQSSAVSQLEHWIPVEISLPLNRIDRVEDLAIEIDNFDVDLLSTRALNVTGVLSLRGLQVSAPQTPVWRDDSFTVVHQAQPEPANEPEPFEAAGEQSFPNERELTVDEPSDLAAEVYRSNEPLTRHNPDKPDEPAASEQQSPAEEVPKESGWLSMFQNSEQQAKGSELTTDDLEAELPRNSEVEAAEQEGPVASAAAVESVAEPITEHSADMKAGERPQEGPAEGPTQASTEGPEVKLSAGPKQVDKVVRIQSGVGLLSQLGENGAKREAEIKEQQAAIAEQKAISAQNAPSASSGDELEWTRLFLSNGTEANTFKKVKMCIVQREETLESIATRYNVQPRELQLYNRLHDPYLSEGQVLYIP